MATGRPLVISLARYATPIRQYSVSPQSFAAWRARPSAQFMGWFSAVQRRGPILPASVPGGRKGGAEVYTSTSPSYIKCLAFVAQLSIKLSHLKFRATFRINSCCHLFAVA